MESGRAKGDADVLVVGAGPVGLAMACALARHGVPARIVDAGAGPTDQSRALGVQARTLEVLNRLGVADAMVGAGRKLSGASGYVDRQRIVHVPFVIDAKETRYPFVLILPQSDTERFLLAALREAGGDVDRRTTVGAICQDDSGVTATLQGPDGLEAEVRARWLVGCDGARSVVRKALGIAFEGAEYDEGFLLADVRVGWDRPDDEITLILTPEGPMAGFPLPEPGRWRLIKGSEDRLLPADASPDRIVARFRELIRAHGLADAEVADPSWTSAFRIHHRVAGRFRSGRCFLAGDAAHIHSPAGGQGMNTGIQDAFNLAWKLAQVIRGDSPDRLLDSYSAERRAVAAEVVRATHLATRMITLRDPIARALRNRIVPVVLGLPAVRRRLVWGLSELAVEYRRGPLSAEDRATPPWSASARAFDAGLRPGDRVPDVPLDAAPGASSPRLHDALRGSKPVLLLFEGSAGGADGDPFGGVLDVALGRHAGRIDVLRVVAGEPGPDPPGAVPILRDPAGSLHARFGARDACLYLVRPDGYVGYRALPPDADRLAAYLGRVFLDPGPDGIKGRRNPR